MEHNDSHLHCDTHWEHTPLGKILHFKKFLFLLCVPEPLTGEQGSRGRLKRLVHHTPHSLSSTPVHFAPIWQHWALVTHVHIHRKHRSVNNDRIRDGGL